MKQNLTSAERFTGKFYQQRLRVSILLLTVIAFSNLAQATVSGDVKGFRFQTCDTKYCFQLTSAKASISNIDFGFTTLAATGLMLTDASGLKLREFSGTTATYYPEIATISLDDEAGKKTYLISLRTARVQEFSMKVQP